MTLSQSQSGVSINETNMLYGMPTADDDEEGEPDDVQIMRTIKIQ